MKHYFAIIHKNKDRPYSVIFPDLPGCLSAGDTYGGAIQNATEALRRYFESANGEKPEPRSFEELIANKKIRKNAADVAFVGIPLLMEKGQIININITMDAVDHAAHDRDVTRSVFQAQAAKEKIYT